jgi:pullulanase/glycogen debranching enzyme
MIHSGVLLHDQVARLQKANEATTKRRARKKKRIQKQGILTKAEGSKIIAQKDVDAQFKGKTRQSRTHAGGSAQQQRRCRRCGETGHNARTYQKDAENTVD